MNHNTTIIEKMINGGYGLARSEEGQVMLLHNGLPGERVSCSIVEKRKQTLFGTVDEIITPHPWRISPPCPYYGGCGGCQLQHCSYGGQLECKHRIVEELFEGIAPGILPPRPSPQQLGYRQRIRLLIRSGSIGFRKFRSAEIIPIEACLLAHPAINGVLKALLQDAHFQTLCKQSCEAEFLYNPGRDAVTVLLYYRRRPRPNDFSLATELAARTGGLDSVFFKGETFPLEGPAGPTARSFRQRIPATQHTAAFTLNWEVGGFCQVNMLHNHNLIGYVGQLCTGGWDRGLLDLFCGMGNFSIPLAHTAESLVGVEGQGASIRSAQVNSSAAGLHNTRFIKGDIAEVCRGLVQDKRRFDTTILDPPRSGVPRLAPLVSALTERAIIYISCDPATLVRDIKELCQNGFRLISVQPFDMFPQTYHIETVAFLEKN